MRELVVLGTASQVPTRTRNHNGYLLRFDTEGILFDPGEGTQRQLLLAGVAATSITRLCLTHFHGDHCLGVPGIIQRLSLDKVSHPVSAHYPDSGQEFFDRLRHASSFYDTLDLRQAPVRADGPIWTGPVGTLSAYRLDHSLDAYGYSLVEPDGRRLLPDRLAAHAIAGPLVGELQRAGRLVHRGRTVTLEDVSEHRAGQRFAFVMDTRMCDAIYTLADRADMLVIESTYLDLDRALAEEFGHLTAAQGAQIAAATGVRRLVLTHFSQRYPDPTAFATEARRYFDGDIVIAEDLTRVPLPRRR